MSYNDVRLIQAELAIRIRNMRGQVRDRLTLNPEWTDRINVAMRITEEKIRLINHRIETIVANAIKSADNLDSPDNRINLIRFLLHTIDNRKDSFQIPESSRPIIDAARRITDSSMMTDKFTDGYRYDPETVSIVDPDGIQIARITAPGCMRDEIGHVFEKAISLLSLAQRSSEGFDYIRSSTKCDEVNHDPSRCFRCRMDAISSESQAIVGSLK